MKLLSWTTSVCSPHLASVPAQLRSCTELWDPWFGEVPRQLFLVVGAGEDSGREGLSISVLEDLCGSAVQQGVNPGSLQLDSMYFDK